MGNSGEERSIGGGGGDVATSSATEKRCLIEGL